jgi:hypothetical protein
MSKAAIKETDKRESENNRVFRSLFFTFKGRQGSRYLEA